MPVVRFHEAGRSREISYSDTESEYRVDSDWSTAIKEKFGGYLSGIRRTMTSDRNPRLIDLPKINDPRGNLSFIEAERHIPFTIQRVFYLYDVPGGESRAGHALNSCHQFIVAIAGAFDAIVDDGLKRSRHHLNRSYFGLYIPPLV